MTEQNPNPDIAKDDEDTTGHAHYDTSDDDTEGHARAALDTNDDDDTTGHIVHQ